MDESYETFEEELGPPRPPQKPGRQILRPEMYASRKPREEVQQQHQQHPHPPQQLTKTAPREAAPSVREPVSVQNGSAPMDRPWESVTLNRCLIVVITILLLTSGLHRLHEMLRGERITEEEEEEFTMATRRSALRRKALYNLPEPESSLWDVMLLWWPDFDDDEDCYDDECDDDEDGGGAAKRAKSKKRAVKRRQRGDKKAPPKHGRLKDDEGPKEKTKKERKKPKEHEEEDEGGNEEEEEEEKEEEEKKEDEVKAKRKKMKEKKKEGLFLSLKFD